jgi:hypothetical protein
VYGNESLLLAFYGCHGLSLNSLAPTYSPTGGPAVPSALKRFTAEFGMGSGGSILLWTPGNLKTEQTFASGLAEAKNEQIDRVQLSVFVVGRASRGLAPLRCAACAALERQTS